MNASASDRVPTHQKRAVPRYVFRRTGQFHVPPSTLFSIKTIDISTQGMGVMSPNAVPIGANCAIKVPVFQDGVANALIVECKVMCCILSGTEGYRIGVKFNGVDTATKKLLDQIIQNCFS